jgi:hypothetical protein
MTTLVVNSQSIQEINLDAWIVHFDIQTAVMPTIKFDMTIDHKKEITLIVSNEMYLRIHKDFASRVNSNSCEIKVCSYNGGKELARIAPSTNLMGNVSYPDIHYTLLSQIEVPPTPQPNTIYIFVIDSYPGLQLVEYETIKNNLIEQDNKVFMSKLKNFHSEANKVNSEIKLVLESSVNQAISKSYFDESGTSCFDESGTSRFDHIHKIVSDSNKLTKCLGDIIFGCVFGGIQTEFSSIITPNSGWTILDAFATSKTRTHKLTIRGSGLGISGNNSSSIGIILKRTSDSIKNFELTDINLGTKICEFVLDDESKYPKHQDAINLSKYLGLIEYTKTISQFIFGLNTNPELKVKIKEHMKSNSEYISTIEYDNFDDFAIKEDHFKNIINEKICSLISSIKSNFANIRSKFAIVKPLDNSMKILNHSPSQLQIDYGFTRELENDLEYDLPCSIASRQTSICTTGYKY